jgi:uracil-DNA glycosylase
MAEIRLSESWKKRLENEFEKTYMKELKKFLQSELAAGKRIFPDNKNFFKAMDETPFESVKVVILGQDPYHGEGEAHGLCFSVQKGVALPPSLKNIFKELNSDLGIQIPRTGNLESWARQGVLLLNSILTVQKDQPASHRDRGWESFTDQIIAQLNSSRSHLVFVLWGSYAQRKGAFIDRNKHFVISSPHPSPLSAHRGFFGSKPFSKINAYLKQHSIEPVDWGLPDA